MKAGITLLLAAAIWTSSAWAQSSTPQTPPAGAQAQTGAGTAKGAPRSGPMAGMQGRGMDIQKMQADLNRMHALLNSMRGSVTSMDPRDQPAMLSNIELWQLMLDHMDQMVKHMQSMQQGMGMMPGPHAH